MNIFKEWWKRFSHQRKTKAREAGYRWAMHGFRSCKLTPEEAEGYIAVSRHFDKYSEFDKGVEQACSDWSRRDETM